MENKHSILGKLSALGLTLIIAGCGGGGDRNRGQNTAGQDSFIARVMAVIGNTSETAEPIDIKSIDVTSPENTEPASVR